MNRLVGLLLVLFLVLPYTVPTFSASATASQLLYVKQWYGVTYYFYNDKVVVMDSSGDNITLYNELGAIVSRLNLTSYQLLISRNNVTYYYHVDVTMFGKTYTFKILIMFLFSETGTSKIKVIIDLPFRIPKWIGKALFKWRLPGEFKQHGYRLIRRHLFIDFSDMARHGKLGRMLRGRGYFEVESIGFDSRLVIDPVIGVLNGTTTTTGTISYYYINNPIVNPGFENGLAPWTSTISWSFSGGVNITSSTVYEGSYSAVMYVSQNITGDVWLRQNLTRNILVHGISLHYYVKDPFTKLTVILYSINPLTIVFSDSLPQTVTGTWLSLNYNFTSPIRVGYIEIWGETINETGEVFIDSVSLKEYVLAGSNTTIFNGTYIVYSESNATYTYYINPPNNISIGYYVPITVSTSLTSPVYNYSLELNLSALGFTGWANTAPNGSDIYFLDANGKPLYYWIQEYNSTTQQGIIWVNTTLTNTTIYMYYGDTNPYTTYNDPNRVFLWYDTQGDPSKYVISSITGTATWSQDTTNGNPAPSLEATYSSSGEEIVYPSNINLVNVIIEADVHGSSYSVNVQPTVGVRYASGTGIIEYRIHPVLASGTYSAGIIYKDLAGGTDTVLWTTSSFTLDSTTWYHVVGIAYNGEVRMLVYDQNGNLLTDSGWISTTYTSGGYAGAVYVDGVSGTSIWWDNIRIYKYVDPSSYSVSMGAPANVFPQLINVSIVIPKGFDVVNITRSDNITVQYFVSTYNITHDKVTFLDLYGFNYTIYLTAWNSITDLYTDYKYYPYGFNATVHVRLLDPYGFPINNTNITIYYIVGNTVKQYIGTTDQYGWANISIILPSMDSKVTVQAQYNGTYVGIRNTTFYVTGYSWSVRYAPGTAVRKGESITMEFTVTRTVDNTTPDGWLYMDFNGSALVSEVRNGYASRMFSSNISGEWNLTIIGFRDIDSPANTTINRIDKLVWCGVDISYSVTPAKYYYNINETITVNYYIAYDTGQTRNWTITVYQNGNTIYTATGYSGSFTVTLDWDNNITISVLELDNKTTTTTITIHALYINIEGYLVSSLNGTNILYMHTWLSDQRSIIGAYTIGIYGEPANKTIDYYDSGTYTVQLFFTELNTTALRIDVAITNLETSPHDYTVSITAKPYYFGGVGYTVSTTIHVEPYRNNYTSLVMLFDNLSYGMIMYYELNITVDGQAKIYKNVLPFLPGYGLYDSVETVQGFSRKSEDYIIYHIGTRNATLVIMTPVGLVSKPSAVGSTLSIAFNVSLDTSRIYESGENLNITVSMSPMPFPAEIRIVFNGIEYSYGAENKTYTITIPSLPAYVFQTYPVTITLIVAGLPVKQYTYTIMVYNSGPKIMLISPTEYSQINGTVTITLYVYDPSGVESVLWKWDFEDSWHNASLDGYYAYITYDTLKIQNGLARLMVKATDRHGYTSDAVYYFNIYNPVNEARMNQLLYNIGQFISRYIFVPGLITGILTTVIGMWIGYAFRKRREQKEKIVVVLQKGVNKK